MKKILSKINKELIFNIIIVLIVIALYIAVASFIYSDFRERKRKDIANSIIEKIDKQIKELNDAKDLENNLPVKVVPPKEINAEYNGVNYTVIGKIKIDKIGIYDPILKENTKGSLDASAVKIAGPDLNSNGNVVIGGHNYMKGNFFIKINKLRQNDKITITDLSGKSVDYYVYDYNVTSIDDASYLAQPNNEEDKILTLVTCTKGGKQRYYVKAKAK